MAKQQNAKKGKHRRVAPAKIAYYWGVSHPINMVKRGLRVLSQHGRGAADSFVAKHAAGCRACENILAARFQRAVAAKGAA